MNNHLPLYESNLLSIPKVAQGKVRDIYAADETHLLIVTSDRISAFDVILPDPIPGKGRLLTEISNFWFHKLKSIIPNHLSQQALDTYLTQAEIKQLDGRGMLVKKLKPLPVEAVVRGYIAGSGWKDYQRTQRICGVELPPDLCLADKLETPIFTPATKAAVGDHDENISFQQLTNAIGIDYAKKVRDISTELYLQASHFAKTKGIIIADTKFEFGLDENENLVLIDEALTPDSSRFWPEDQYQAGINPPSFDKQFIRDYLETLDWNKTAPGPHLPVEIIQKSTEKYQDVFKRLTT